MGFSPGPDRDQTQKLYDLKETTLQLRDLPRTHKLSCSPSQEETSADVSEPHTELVGKQENHCASYKTVFSFLLFLFSPIYPLGK